MCEERTNDIKQIMITRFKVPIEDVEEIFNVLKVDVDFLPNGSSVELDDTIILLQQKITNLKALLPTRQ